MDSKVHKWCAVPKCVNTSNKTPDKLFVYVPDEKKKRFIWLNLAGLDPKALSQNSDLYFCEDHFDLPNDMANYGEYKVMGNVKQVRMKPGSIPTKFECQSKKRKRVSDTSETAPILKKKKKDLKQDIGKGVEKKSTGKRQLKLVEKPSKCSVPHGKKAKMSHKKKQVRQTMDKSTQVDKSQKKAVPSKIKSAPEMTSLLKPSLKSASTSSFQITSCAVPKPSISSLRALK